MFAVITGRNGVGKTSLLKAIRDSLGKRIIYTNIYKNVLSKQAACRKFSSIVVTNQTSFRESMETDYFNMSNDVNEKLTDEPFAFATTVLQK
jgi:AAA15 family ATPase/GTPase